MLLNVLYYSILTQNQPILHCHKCDICPLLSTLNRLLSQFFEKSLRIEGCSVAPYLSDYQQLTFYFSFCRAPCSFLEFRLYIPGFQPVTDRLLTFFT